MGLRLREQAPNAPEALATEEDRINESRLALARQYLGHGSDKTAEEDS